MALKFINKLQNQRVLVVGGSTGIGFAVALGALEHGAHVVLSSSNQIKLDRAVDRLKAHVESGGLSLPDISAKTCDLSNPDTIDDNIKSLLEFATQQGKLDHVVYTAGDAIKTVSIDKVNAHDIPKIGMVRTAGVLILAKYLSSYTNQSTNSSLTLTGGTMSWRPSPGWSVLTGVAGGVESLARGLAVDLKPVRVNCAVPGAIHTELFDSIPEERLEAALKNMRRDTITGSVGTPEEMAEVYLYLMKSTFATGSTVTADGGRMVGDSKDADIII
ncbi:dehyrdogenase/reductase domain-containing protein [Mariannaea sp. PMI_226]|nr:dehyrdogenase/reductase domain-containing protein [Mariannaea sp. PMI_226]